MQTNVEIQFPLEHPFGMEYVARYVQENLEYVKGFCTNEGEQVIAFHVDRDLALNESPDIQVEIEALIYESAVVSLAKNMKADPVDSECFRFAFQTYYNGLDQGQRLDVYRILAGLQYVYHVEDKNINEGPDPEASGYFIITLSEDLPPYDPIYLVRMVREIVRTAEDIYSEMRTNTETTQVAIPQFVMTGQAERNREDLFAEIMIGSFQEFYNHLGHNTFDVRVAELRPVIEDIKNIMRTYSFLSKRSAIRFMIPEHYTDNRVDRGLDGIRSDSRCLGARRVDDVGFPPQIEVRYKGIISPTRARDIFYSNFTA